VAGGDKGHRSKVRERREALVDRTDAPVMHIEARHAQVGGRWGWSGSGALQGWGSCKVLHCHCAEAATPRCRGGTHR